MKAADVMVSNVRPIIEFAAPKRSGLIFAPRLAVTSRCPMELRHLRYFLAVADTRNFTRAAERLHVTQPTLSHQVKQLESMIGTVLFERSTKESSSPPPAACSSPIASAS